MAGPGGQPRGRTMAGVRGSLLTRLARIAGAAVSVAAVLLIALLILDRFMERRKGSYPKDAMTIHYEWYVERWPFCVPWRWVNVQARVRGYDYDADQGTLRLRLRGLSPSRRERRFLFRVERLPDGLLDELDSVKGNDLGSVEFWHFATFFGDGRDDSEGDLTIYRSFPCGYEFADYDLRGGTTRRWQKVWGDPESHEWLDEGSRLRLVLVSGDNGTKRGTFEFDVGRMPDGLEERLEAVEADVRNGLAKNQWLGVTHTKRDGHTECILGLATELLNGRRYECFDLDDGTAWVDWSVLGILRDYEVQDESEGLLLKVADVKDGTEWAVRLEHCTVTESLRADLDKAEANQATTAVKIDGDNRRFRHRVSLVGRAPGPEDGFYY